MVDGVIFLTFLISFILRFLETNSGQDEPFESKAAAQTFYGWVLIASVVGVFISGIGLTARKILHVRHMATTALRGQVNFDELGGTAGGYTELIPLVREGSQLLSSEEPEPETSVERSNVDCMGQSAENWGGAAMPDSVDQLSRASADV
jgi:hypothetical protein